VGCVGEEELELLLVEVVVAVVLLLLDNDAVLNDDAVLDGVDNALNVDMIEA
jgi:hypothetical protein